MVTTSRLAEGIRWNDAAGRYVGADGRFLPVSTVQGALQATLDRTAVSVRTITEQVRAGQMSVAAWQAEMATHIKTTHLASSALANGGWAQMTQSDYGRVGGYVKSQLQYLRAFSAQVADGTQKLDGTLTRRADLYARSGRQTYEAAVRAEMRLRGAAEHRSVLGSADHCDECVELDALGWQPVTETIPLPGARTCLSRCACSMEYRASPAA